MKRLAVRWLYCPLLIVAIAISGLAGSGTMPSPTTSPSTHTMAHPAASTGELVASTSHGTLHTTSKPTSTKSTACWTSTKTITSFTGTRTILATADDNGALIPIQTLFWRAVEGSKSEVDTVTAHVLEGRQCHVTSTSYRTTEQTVFVVAHTTTMTQTSGGQAVTQETLTPYRTLRPGQRYLNGARRRHSLGWWAWR